MALGTGKVPKRELKGIEYRLKLHSLLMDKYIQQGMDKETASKRALTDIENGVKKI